MPDFKKLNKIECALLIPHFMQSNEFSGHYTRKFVENLVLIFRSEHFAGRYTEVRFSANKAKIGIQMVDLRHHKKVDLYLNSVLQDLTTNLLANYNQVD